jgi:hypothetical protein
VTAAFDLRGGSLESGLESGRRGSACGIRAPVAGAVVARSGEVLPDLG